jgi:pimeloyl-ACP methyl ester carboxylesterase
MSNYLLVHGAWAGGWVWDDLAERLEKAGHRVRVVDRLPSAGTDPESLGDLTADANYVRQLLDTEPVNIYET